MSVMFRGGPPRAAESAQAQTDQARSDNVNWLPRSRLRSGRGGDRLLTALTVATAAVLAAAAGVAAWSRQGDFASLQMFASDKATERAPAARAPAAPPPPGPVVRSVTSSPAAPAPADRPAASPARVAPPPAEASAPPPSPAPVTTIRMTPEGAPVAPAPERTASTPPESRLPQASPPAPLAREQVIEPVPPIPPSNAPPLALPSAAPAPPPAAAAAPAPAPARSPAPFRPQDLGFDQTPPAEAPPAPARAASAAADRGVVAATPPQRAAPPPPPAAPGEKVAIYLDEFPDQKAAAAALGQKAAAYGKFIGSAGKLTYSRKLGNEWRLRVSNLDQDAAQALCAKLTGAGAPCAVGPN